MPNGRRHRRILQIVHSYRQRLCRGSIARRVFIELDSTIVNEARRPAPRKGGVGEVDLFADESLLGAQLGSKGISRLLTASCACVRAERQERWFARLESTFTTFGGVPEKVPMDNPRVLVRATTPSADRFCTMTS